MSVMEPTAPVSPPAHQRARGFSIRSDKSHPSSQVSAGSGKTKTPKVDLTETHAEKRRLTTSGKANPNAAMNEAQPIAAALEKPTLNSLRSVQHVDNNGNPITDPDLSNPTRSRWERPLDTIRSFEAAIETEYKQRRSMIRSDTAPSIMGGYASHRSSYYGGHDQNSNHRSSQVGGYYGNRATRDSYIENDYGAPMAGPVSRNRFSQRIQSTSQVPQYQNGQDVYPNGPYQRSRDTMNTAGASSGSQSEPWANHTDPSSENSSLDRMTRNDLGEPYGQRGYGGPPGQFTHPALHHNGNDGMPPSPSRGGPVQDIYAPTSPSVPPPVPAHDPGHGRSGSKRIIKLGPSGGSTQGQGQPMSVGPPVKPPLQSTPSQKKKSWLKRRFSTKGSN